MAPIMEIRLRVEETPSGYGEYLLATCSGDVANSRIGEDLRTKDREHFIVLMLNTRNEVCGVEVVSIGTLNSSVVHPREVFKGALMHNASSIIAMHNHPSGDVTPSTADVCITKKLLDAGKMIGIPLRDHIIVGEGYFSAADNNFWGYAS